VRVGLVFAQLPSTGFSGVVSDSTGAVIPRAPVTVVSQATGFAQTIATNEVGVYSFPDLAPGLYQISAEAAGFRKAVATEVRLYVGQMLVQNFRLEVGATTQSVTVTGSAPLLRQTTSDVGTVIEGKGLTEIPLNGRNFLQLDLLSPGVTRSKNSNTFDAVVINPTQQSFNVNGQRGDYNRYLLDGTSIKEYQHGSNTFSPNVDAVQEFEVATSNYAAAFGTEAGAQVDLVTKSGTNNLHGDIFEFLRNNQLDARNFFSQTQGAEPLKRNQFGATVGGPFSFPHVYSGKDKTFFFLAWESFREAKVIPQLGNYPTPAELAGNLSDMATPGNPVIDPYSGLPFANNVIPPGRIPSTLEPFLQNGIGQGPWIPAPDSLVPGANYYLADTRRFSNDQGIARIDQRIGNNTFIFGRYAINDARLLNPNINPNWHYAQANRGQSAAFHLARSVKANLASEFTFGWSRFHQAEAATTAFKDDITNKILQIQGNSTFPDSDSAPGWNPAGYSGLGEGTPGPRRWRPDIFEFRGAFTGTLGRHSLKWGMDFQRFLDTFQEIEVPNGINGFDGRFSGYPLGDFLLGLPASTLALPGPFDPQQRYSGLAPYVQDDWKITSHLVLNLGLRYEWFGVPFSNNRSIGNIYFGPNHAYPQLVVSDGAKPITFEGQQQTFWTGMPFVTASKVGLPENLAYNQNTNFGPRVGFAYSVPTLRNTVIRGGYGIFYQSDIEDKWVETSIDPPFVKAFLFALDQTNFRQFNWFNPYADASIAAAQVYGNDIHFKRGQIKAWNLSLEHTTLGTLFSAAYVGNMDTHLPSYLFPNQATAGPSSVPIPSRQLWPGAGTINLATYDGTSSYHSLQLKVHRTFSNGFALLAGYTWSKDIDDTGGTDVGEGERGYGYQNSYDRRDMRGLAAQDIRHRFVASYTYELPFGRGKHFLNRRGAPSVLLGGWQTSGVTTFQSGSPFTALEVSNCANSDVGAQRPDRIGNPNNLSHSRPTGQQVAEFFNTAAFADVCPAGPNVGPFRWGNAGRHTVIGPGINDWDFALNREFKITESKRIQFRSEYFNLFNHPIFGQPGSVLGTPQFGEILNTAVDSREIQFALKFYF